MNSKLIVNFILSRTHLQYCKAIFWEDEFKIQVVQHHFSETLTSWSMSTHQCNGVLKTLMPFAFLPLPSISSWSSWPSLNQHRYHHHHHHHLHHHHHHSSSSSYINHHIFILIIIYSSSSSSSYIHHHHHIHHQHHHHVVISIIIYSSSSS